MDKYILKENLAVALRIAIEIRQDMEKENSYTSDSILLAGWKEALKELESKNLYIKY